MFSFKSTHSFPNSFGREPIIIQGKASFCVLPKEEAMSMKCCDEAQVLSAGLMLLLLPRPDLFLKENTGKVLSVKGIVAPNWDALLDRVGKIGREEGINFLPVWFRANEWTAVSHRIST